MENLNITFLFMKKIKIVIFYDIFYVDRINILLSQIKKKSNSVKKNNGPGFSISNTLPPTLVILCAQYDIKYCNLKMDQVVPSHVFFI